MKAGEKLFDAISGQEVKAGEVRIEARGIAALVSIPSDKFGHEIRSFLAKQHRKAPSYDKSTRQLQPMPIAVGQQHPHLSQIPAGMLPVEAGMQTITTHFRVRECGERGYARMTDSQYPSLHQGVAEPRSLHLDAFALADREVTNAEYAKFIQATHYSPKVRTRFLEHWVNGAPRPGEEDRPVVYVDLEDARAYAAWKGLRLPNDAEWQVAMEIYKIPAGGHAVWNWTGNEYSDGRTRFFVSSRAAAHLRRRVRNGTPMAGSAPPTSPP